MGKLNGKSSSSCRSRGCGQTGRMPVDGGSADATCPASPYGWANPPVNPAVLPKGGER
jgi:hypothetical protein